VKAPILLDTRPQVRSLAPQAFSLIALLTVASNSGALAPVHQSGFQCCTATIRVRVPDSTATVYLAGSLPQLGPWHPDGLVTTGTGRERTVRVTAPPGTAFEYKFTLGSWDREALTSSGTVPINYRIILDRDTVVVNEVAGFKRDPLDYIADWRGSGVKGRLVYWTDVASRFLGPQRHVEIWLPPGYDDSPTTRYPVLYMHDGKNLFDPRLANTGVDWGVDEAVVDLVSKGVIPPIIVVGVWSTAARAREYSPWHDAPAYARFLIEELMPRVNREFRTRTGPANTAVMGSSMGGLLSYYLVTYHPEVFGACGCMSTHFPLSEAVAAQVLGIPAAGIPDTTPYIIRDIRSGLRVPRGVRYWFDYGTLSTDSTYGPTHAAVRTWLLGQGLVEGRDFVVRRYEGASHYEAAWRARLKDPLTFLFGRRTKATAVPPYRPCESHHRRPRTYTRSSLRDLLQILESPTAG
jgi:pimeloyl-ACP methyl ester carboxylesterase